MKKSTIGDMIAKLRCNQNIEKGELCRGLCSESSLRRIEMGECMPSMFLTEAILQRLGKSPAKLELFIMNRDDILLQIRKKIVLGIKYKMYDGVMNNIKQYSDQKEAKEPIHRQFIYKAQALIYIVKKDYSKAEIFLERAILTTIPDYFERLRKEKECICCRNEILLILLYVDVNLLEKKSNVIEHLDLLEKTVIHHYSDKEEFSNIYPQIVHMFIKYYMQTDRMTDAKKVYQSGLSILKINGNMEGIYELKKMGYVDNLFGEKQSFCEGSIFNEFYCINEHYDTNKIMSYGDIHYLNEMMQYKRKILNLTQENLAEKMGCEQKTISCIENGKQVPTLQNLKKIMSYLDIDLEQYCGILITDDFLLLEIEKKLYSLLYISEFDKAKDYLELIKVQINKNYKRNHQYILFTDVYIDWKSNKITNKEAIEEFKKAFYLTYSKHEEIISNESLLSVMEVCILHQIIIAQVDIVGVKQCISRLGNILKIYQNGRPRGACLPQRINLIRLSITSFLTKEKQYEKAIIYCKDGIYNELLNGNLSVLILFLEKLIIIYKELKDIKNQVSIKNEIQMLKNILNSN